MVSDAVGELFELVGSMSVTGGEKRFNLWSLDEWRPCESYSLYHCLGSLGPLRCCAHNERLWNGQGGPVDRTLAALMDRFASSARDS
jgi:hypothetical protein